MTQNHTAPVADGDRPFTSAGPDHSARFNRILNALLSGEDDNNIFFDSIEGYAAAAAAASLLADWRQSYDGTDYFTATVKRGDVLSVIEILQGWAKTLTDTPANHVFPAEPEAPRYPILPSKAFKDEHPWCGWTLAFAHESDWDTAMAFGFERLVGINVLLTTADGRSRPVNIVNSQYIDEEYLTYTPGRDCSRKSGIEVKELETDTYEPINPDAVERVPYEDIREVVVY